MKKSRLVIGILVFGLSLLGPGMARAQPVGHTPAVPALDDMEVFQHTQYDRGRQGASRGETDTTAIPLEPTDQPIVLRSYVEHRGEKKLLGVFVGDPEGVHYALDLEQAALLYVWRGAFLDAGTVWRGRGMEPDSRKLDAPVPLESMITFSGAPNIAFLDNQNSVWPDTLGRRYRFKGYSLDPFGRPTFKYRLGGVAVADHFTPARNGRVLRRRLTFDGLPEDETLWSRIATGEVISRLSDDSYEVEDHTFIIEMAESGDAEPIIRRRGGRAELLVPIDLIDGQAALTYYIIW